MIEKLVEGTDNILVFRAEGKLTESDYRDVLVPEIERAVKEYGKIRVLFRIEHFDGWTVGGAWEDMSLGLRFRSVGKMAIVVDETWDEWMTLLFRVFAALTQTDMRFFRKERLQEAWDWILFP